MRLRQPPSLAPFRPALFCAGACADSPFWLVGFSPGHQRRNLICPLWVVQSGTHMDAEVTSFINLPVYTHGGRYVGVVQNVILDLPNRRVGALLLTRTSTKLIEGGHNVAVPYRWVASVGDIVILSHFPDKVVAQPRSAEEAEEEAQTVTA
jgi:sporulation protein YlmC with PRC-barrel domain